MKPNLIITNVLNVKCFKVFLFIFISCIAFFGQSAAQGTVCTNSIKINTGYSPCTASLVPYGSQDPNWIVYYLSSGDYGVLSASTAALYPDYNAFVPAITSPWVNDFTDARFISIDNSQFYSTVASGDYEVTFDRPFRMCGCDNVTLDLYVENDFGVEWISIDDPTGTTIIPGSSIPYNAGGSPAAAHITFTTSTCLSAGTHHIYVRLMNDAITSSTNGHGLNIHGTVSSSTSANSIVAEAVSPIVGFSTICVGDTRHFTDPEPGGDWSSSNPSVASIDASGNVSGVSSGTATITYLVGTCYATYDVTISTLSPIVGPSTLCAGSTITLSDPMTPGSWSCSGCAPTLATLSATGDLTAPAGSPGGTVTISYASGSCAPATMDVTINPIPDVCVNVTCCDYDFNFTSSITTPGPIFADYNIIFSCPVCSTVVYGPAGPTPVPGTVTLAAIQSIYSGSTGVCVLTIHNGTCSWPVPHSSSCCGSANGPYDFTGYPKHSVNNGGASSQQNYKELAIIPNPNLGSFNINGSVENTPVSKEGTLEIIDMLGRVIYKDIVAIKNNEINTNISIGDNVANGVYFIKFRNENYQKVLQFTLQK